VEADEKYRIFYSFTINALDSARDFRPVNGRTFPPFEDLQVVMYPGDNGIYLLRLCSNGQVADTWHESFEDAFHQAEFEFGISKDRWALCSEKLTN
jgi:hypothetical protein